MQTPDNDDIRERLERALSHPESAEILKDELQKIVEISQQEQPPAVVTPPEPIKTPTTAVTFFAGGCLLASLLCIGIARNTPLKTSYEVCFNPNRIPDEPKCLGATKQRIDEDKLSQIQQNKHVYAINRQEGHPVLAIGLGVIGTAFGGLALQMSRNLLQEKTNQTVTNRLARRHEWTQEKIKADASVKAAHESTKLAANSVEVINAHTLTAESSKAEFTSIQSAIYSLPPEIREDFVKFLALKEAEKQAHLQAQQQQDPLAQLLGTAPSTLPAQVGVIPNTQQLIKVGESMINNLVTAERSIIFLGVPGSGKSVSMRVLIGRKRRHYGDKLTLYAIGSKGGDTFAGIKTVSYAGNLLEAWEVLKEIYEEHRYRQDELSANQRKKTGTENPICLVFDDYKNFCDRMKSKEGSIPVDFPGASQQVEMRDAFNNAMSDIAFNGREGGISLIIGTQASNVTDLPFLGSAQARESTILCFQARQNPESKANGFGVIDGVFKNAHLIGDAQIRQTLINQYPEVKKASIELGQPVILSSITDSGEWALGIIPDITKEDEEYSAQYSGDSSPSTVERNSRLSEKGQAFLDYLKRTDKQSISLRDACRSFSFKGNKQSVDEMRGILQELHSCELGELQSDTFTLF